MKPIKLFFITLVFFCVGVVYAGSVTGLTEFFPDTTAKSSEVNDNFNKIAIAVNDNNGRISSNSGSLAIVDQNLANIIDSLYVPFKVTTSGGICNTAVIGSANPQIIISSDAADGTFLVNSILVRTNDVPPTGFYAFSTNSVTIDGNRFDVRTANLTGNVDGTGVLESFDVMGTPTRVIHSLTSHERGGNFPLEIVADSAGANDIVVRFFCRSDVQDFSVGAVHVSGWKRIKENISVQYIPGN